MRAEIDRRAMAALGTGHMAVGFAGGAGDDADRGRAGAHRRAAADGPLPRGRGPAAPAEPVPAHARTGPEGRAAGTRGPGAAGSDGPAARDRGLPERSLVRPDHVR